MSEHRLISKTGIVVDLILAAAFYIFMLGHVRSHVPLEAIDYPIASSVIAYLTTGCLTGVFWLALGCFRLTWVDQRLQRKKTTGGCACKHH